MGMDLIHQTIGVVPQLNGIVTEHYGLVKNDIKDLYKFMNSTIADSYENNFSNPYELIVSLRAYPFWMYQFFQSVGTRETFPIGRYSKNDVGIKGSKLSNQRNHISLGTYTFTRKFNNFMDYAPYTKIDMYVPMGFGYITLDVNEVMGKTIDIRASMDFDNGTMQLFIVCEGKVIQTQSSKVGAEITLTQTNNTERSRNMYLSLIKTALGIGSIYTGSKDTWNASAISVGGQGATSLYNAMMHHTHVGNIGEGRNQLIAPTSIYMIIQRPNPIAITNDYNHIYGKPLEDVRTLSTLTGYTIIRDIHLNGFDKATEGEMTEIETLLKQGVHL